MRLILTKLHRWLAWSAGWILVVVAGSGALYAFEPQIRALWGEHLAPAEAGPILHPGALEARLRAQGRTGSIAWLLWPVQSDLPVWVRWQGTDGTSAHWMVDPRTGDFLPRATTAHLWMQRVLNVHRTLAAGEVGRWITGVATFALVISVLSGLVLAVRQWRAMGRIWWPARAERRHGHPRIRWRLGHRVLGAWLAPGLLVLALTGMTWSFSWTSELVRWLGGGGSGPNPIPVLATADSDRATDWDALWAATAEARAGAGETRFTIPAEPGRPIRFEWSPPDAPFSSFRSHRYYDPATAALIREDPLSAMAAGDRVLRWAYPLHTGRIAGWPGQLAAFGGALGVPALLWTGWRYGRERRRRKPA